MKRTAFASIFTLTLAAGAAHSHGIDATSIPGQAPGAAGHVAGGGSAVMSGGGENITITYSTSGAGGGSGLRTQVPRMTAVTNGKVGAGSALTPEYTEAERAPGREAWIVGGGDNAEVVYSKPR